MIRNRIHNGLSLSMSTGRHASATAMLAVCAGAGMAVRGGVDAPAFGRGSWRRAFGEAFGIDSKDETVTPVVVADPRIGIPTIQPHTGPAAGHEDPGG